MADNDSWDYIRPATGPIIADAVENMLMQHKELSADIVHTLADLDLDTYTPKVLFEVGEVERYRHYNDGRDEVVELSDDLHHGTTVALRMTLVTALGALPDGARNEFIEAVQEQRAADLLAEIERNEAARMAEIAKLEAEMSAAKARLDELKGSK